MKTIAIILAAAAVSILLFYAIIGAIWVHTVEYDHRGDEFTNFLQQYDEGCSDISRVNGTLMCQVPLREEDDAVYVIKLNGAKDDY